MVKFFDERGSIDYAKDGKVTFYGKMHGADSTMNKEELENFRSFFDGLAINYKNHYLLFLTEDDMSLEEFKAEFKKLDKEVELEYKNSREAIEASINQPQENAKRKPIQATSKGETYDISKDENMKAFAQKLKELEQKRGIDVLRLLEKISNKKAVDIKV
ncbi:hypothetical protein LMG7974_01340 [Campylobacter majalis]|uniref:Uncharacterized protein n=1 Tax=Campylobacter majalis TaxID=2790656 RepID=A0ABM8Q8I3_9BACT|nr:hypothetical protein [Campylobacter majalis]CAD7289095.1 hypothetical protein LMG7974_01340 [Campylobacter majalis]